MTIDRVSLFSQTAVENKNDLPSRTKPAAYQISAQAEQVKIANFDDCSIELYGILRILVNIYLLFIQQ